jgi:hypothetical protein
MQLKLENVTPTRKAYMPRYVFYGPNGYGKSEFASQFPSPLFIDMEKNLGHLKTITHEDIGGHFDTLNEFLQFIKELEKQPDLPFKTLVLDSIHTFETKIIKHQVCLESGTDCIETIGGGYGVGSGKIAQLWAQTFAALEHLSLVKNIIIILIGHDVLEKENDTDKNISYPKKVPLIDKKSYQNLMNWSTCVLYIAPNFNMSSKVNSKSLGIPKEKGTSLIHASPDAGFQAKNQYGIIHPMPLNFEVFYEKVTNFYKKELEK